jgi:FtsH-binding integral membrane protein
MAEKNAFGVEMKTMADKKKDKYDIKNADHNNDGIVTEEELRMQKMMLEMEDEDAQRDAIRKMAWFALFGLLVYPIGIGVTSGFGLNTAAQLIADIAPTYFASIAVLVSAFFGADALKGGKKGGDKAS